MMGLSKRFKDAGYECQKYTLDLWGKTVFEEVLLAFKEDFCSENFCFVVRKDDNSVPFIKRCLNRIGIVDYKIIELSENTKGQAHTVEIVLKKLSLKDNEKIAIFNIDTILKSFSIMKLDKCNYFQVFNGLGDHWSFAKIDGNRITETAEKSRISSHCSSGLYIFESSSMYLESYKALYGGVQNIKLTEHYIAPMFNYLISKGLNVVPLYLSRNEIALCGTPDEYQYLKKFHDKDDALNHAS